MGFGGWKNLLAAQTTAFDPLGKAGKPSGWIFRETSGIPAMIIPHWSAFIHGAM
jgi:hypothetical protein